MLLTLSRQKQQYFRDNPKLGDGNIPADFFGRSPTDFRDNPNLGDGKIAVCRFFTLIFDFRDSPKLGDGNFLIFKVFHRQTFIQR